VAFAAQADKIASGQTVSPMLAFATTRGRGKILLKLRVAATFISLIAVIVQSPVSAQTTDTNKPFGNQNPEELQKTADAYEKFLHEPPTGRAPSSVHEVEAHLGTVYFLLHRYRDSLDVLAKIPRDILAPRSSSSASLNTRAEPFPPAAQVWLVTGLDDLELNKPAEAIASLRHALELQPTNATARVALGDAFARSNRMEEAAKEYELQTRQTPSQPEAWYKLGLAHSLLASSPVVFTGEKGPVLRQFDAEQLLDQGRHLDAARELLKLSSIVPQQPGLHADFGRALLEVGYRKAAEEQLRTELTLDPLNPLAHLELAQAAALRGEWQEVSTKMVEASQEEPRELTRLLEKFPAGLVRQAWVQGKMQMPDAFAASSVGGLWRTWMDETQLVRVNPAPEASGMPNCATDSAKLLAPGVWLSETCYNQLLEHLSHRKDLSVPQKLKLAEAEYRLGFFSEALQEAKSILDSERVNDWATYWVLRAHRSLANQCFLEVADLDPNSARSHQILAQNYAAWMEFTKAKTEYKMAISIAPQQPDLHLGLGTVYWRTRDWEEAGKELEIAVQLVPQSAVARYELGDTYLQEGKWQQALDQLKAVPRDATVVYKSTIDLAKAETQLGKTNDAIESLLSVASRDEDGQAHFLLASLYRQSGEPDRAKQALETFKQLHDASLQANGEDETGALEEQLGGSKN
jgi:tetratricopeptide (TPR) repeat protein